MDLANILTSSRTFCGVFSAVLIIDIVVECSRYQ